MQIMMQTSKHKQNLQLSEWALELKINHKQHKLNHKFFQAKIKLKINRKQVFFQEINHKIKLNPHKLTKNSLPNYLIKNHHKVVQFLNLLQINQIRIKKLIFLLIYLKHKLKLKENKIIISDKEYILSI